MRKKIVQQAVSDRHSAHGSVKIDSGRCATQQTAGLNSIRKNRSNRRPLRPISSQTGSVVRNI